MNFPRRGSMFAHQIIMLKRVYKGFDSVFGCKGFKWCELCPFESMLYCPGRAMQDLLQQIEDDIKAENDFWADPDKHDETYMEFIEKRRGGE